MSQPTFFRDQRTIDLDHLKLLWIFHFVGAGLALVGMLFLLAHYAMFSVFLASPQIWQHQKQGPPPKEFFEAFKWLYLILAVWLVGSFVLNVVSALCIHARKCRALSLVVAAINCLHMPLGTLLGVFTIVVLLRDSVRELYEAQPAAPAG